jgi:anti-sigma regulatory factor (Ser/Thr protein kinase)
MDNSPSPKANQDVKITITLPTNSYFMSGIRDFTLALIRNMTDFSEQWAFRFQSVVDELCNNAIEHGSMPGEDIKISFIVHPHESMEILVDDKNNGQNKVKAADLQRIVEERRKPNYVYKGIRGRGLSKIVAEWTDELDFIDLEDGGIRVKIKKYLTDPKIHEVAMGLDSPAHLVIK